MKIAFFIRTLNNSGGTERITCALANHLALAGHDVSIIAWVGGVKSFFALDDLVKVYSLFDKDNVNIYTSYFQTLYRYCKIKRLIEPDYIVDVCVAQSIVSLPANLFCRSKIISWEHFNTAVNWNPITGPLSRKMASLFADKIVVLTSTDKQNYESIYQAKNVCVIGNPLTIKINQRADISQKNVLTVARFTHQKGIDLLLHSWKKFQEKCPDWKLKIVGDGELKPEIVNLRHSLDLDNSVEICGATKDISTYYVDASIYAMSSRFEGMPLVLIEAKSYGLPIVSFDCETGPRDIINHGFDGYLIEPYDLDKYAETLTTLARDYNLREQLSNNALLGLEQFSMSTFISKWIEIL